MIELDNRTSLEVNKTFLNKLASSLTDKNIELIITSADEIKRINNEYRSINKTTDVLSFPYEDMPNAPLGSIIISDWHVNKLSKELGHTKDNELSLLFIHGLLHILGYDHEVDSGEMRLKEMQLIKKFDLPDSLIIRTEG